MTPEQTYQHIRYTAARHVYRLYKRGSKPTHTRTADGEVDNWPDWWTLRYGDGVTFWEYIEEARRHKRRVTPQQVGQRQAVL